MGHLAEGRKTVSELQGLCGLSQSQLSQFLARMRFEGLVASERKGRFRQYAPADRRVLELIVAIEKLYCEKAKRSRA